MLCRLVRVSGPLSGYHHNSFGYLAIMRAMCVKGLTLYRLKSHLQGEPIASRNLTMNHVKLLPSFRYTQSSISSFVRACPPGVCVYA
ncbi:putative transcription regulator Homeodomain-LIKE family [Helianthus anomalus]